MKKFLLAVGLAALMPVAASAGAYTVSVGYADNVRLSPFFPNPFTGATYFDGSGPSFDAGAVMITNTGGSTIVLDSISATVPNWGTDPNWDAFVGAGISLLPGQTAVFTQTGEYNFDTSDNQPSSGNDGLLSTVFVTMDSVASSYSDTGQILNTGGFDAVASNPCFGGNNANNTPGNCNESLQWRLIGTTGVNDPGGTGSVPEPLTISIFGAGVVGAVAMRRRKKSAR